MRFVLQLSFANIFHGDDNDGEEEGDLTTTTILMGGSCANIQITKSTTRENTMLPKVVNAIWNGQPVDRDGHCLKLPPMMDGAWIHSVNGRIHACVNPKQRGEEDILIFQRIWGKMPMDCIIDSFCIR